MQNLEYKITTTHRMNKEIVTKQTLLADMTKEELQALIAAANQQIESQEQLTRASFRFAPHEEVMKLFYEEIEPQ